MSAPAGPECIYGTWRPEGPHTAVDPVETTRVRGRGDEDRPTYACRSCVPTPFDAEAGMTGCTPIHTLPGA